MLGGIGLGRILRDCQRLLGAAESIVGVQNAAEQSIISRALADQRRQLGKLRCKRQIVDGSRGFEDDFRFSIVQILRNGRTIVAS